MSKALNLKALKRRAIFEFQLRSIHTQTHASEIIKQKKGMVSSLPLTWNLTRLEVPGVLVETRIHDGEPPAGKRYARCARVRPKLPLYEKLATALRGKKQRTRRYQRGAWAPLGSGFSRAAGW